MASRDIVYIEWIDASASHTGWTDLEELKSDEDMMCYSVGAIIKETDIFIQLVSNWHANNADGDIKIPKVCIKKLEVLKKIMVE